MKDKTNVILVTHGRDDLKKGCAVTVRDVQEILQRSVIEYGYQ